jgi:hypothetical protein
MALIKDLIDIPDPEMDTRRTRRQRRLTKDLRKLMTGSQIDIERVENHSNLLEPSPKEILESLKSPKTDHDEYTKAVIEAEVTDFGPSETQDLTPLLRRFIEQYRESNVPADLVAVGSAIRTFIAIASKDDAFDLAASLLKAGSRLSLAIELEIEVSKMIVRKLTANPPAERCQYAELALRLEELVDDYARPRFLAREKHGAVALNAILGLVLTRSGRDPEVVERMRTLAVPWFQQLVGRRAAGLRSDLIARASDAKFADIVRILGQLSELDSPSL